MQKDSIKMRYIEDNKKYIIMRTIKLFEDWSDTNKSNNHTEEMLNEYTIHPVYFKEIKKAFHDVVFRKGDPSLIRKAIQYGIFRKLEDKEINDMMDKIITYGVKSDEVKNYLNDIKSAK